MAQHTQINPDALVTALTPINNSLGGKQDKTDNTLTTTDKTISGAINEINTKVSNLTGALTWKGKFDTLPAVTDYKAGNVVGVGNKEYVLTVTGSTKAWEELGDEGSYLLKSVAEETYLKKAVGEVATANIADGAVISAKLATGARRPIIFTPDTTEVDEETYQKLLSDDVDVLFKTFTEDANLCTLTYKTDSGDYLSLYFTCLSIEGIGMGDLYTYAYEVDITKTSPHTCSIIENQNGSFNDILLNSGYVNESTLNPILWEIDLDVSSDENRKSRLEVFEENWKALAGINNLDGARFIGNVPNFDNSGDSSVLFIRQSINENYAGCAMNSDSDRRVLKYEIGIDGSLTITPLFSHLEAITISIDNTPESKAANVAAIKAYVDNLIDLGVDTTKGYMIPITASGRNGFLSTRSGNYPYAGYVAADSSVSDFYNILILGNGEYYDSKIQSENSSELNTISKKLVPAINEVNDLAKSKGNGTITEVKMNGVSKGTSGVVDLGTVITAHQDISGKVDKTTLLNTLMVVDLTSDDIAVRKAALDDFKAKWLALGNTDLTGARFIAKGYFNMPAPPENNVIMTYVENGLVATGYIGIAIASYNSIISSYQVNIALDGTMSFNVIRDSEITDEFRQFAWGEVPTTYLKITDAESTYETKTHVAETLRDYAKSEEIFGMGNMATANAITSIKHDLSLVLKEIDLTGTDADRKAKLDQFAKDWKELTGASDLKGARFAGRLLGEDYTSVFTWSMGNAGYVALSDAGERSEPIKAFLNVGDGSLTITPLFSHLEAITIRTSNTTEAENANKAAIQAYVNNLIELGVDITKEFNVPVRTDNNFYGCLTGKYFGEASYFLSGTIFSVGGANYIKDIYISPSGQYVELVNIQNDNELYTTSKDLIGAINEVNDLAKSKGNGTITEVKMNGASKGTSGVVDLGTVLTEHQDISGKVDKTLNAKAFEGITIKTSNTTEAINANKAAIQSYANNLIELGVDTTKGFNVPVKIDSHDFYGCLTGRYVAGGEGYFLSGSILCVGGETYVKDIYIGPTGYYSELVNIKNDNDLNTTSKDLIGAINEVNTLAKSKGNGTITEVKMNGASKGTSGVVDLGTVITAHQDISGKQDKLISGTNIKTINGESVLGSGDITISSGASSSAYPEVNHGTGDTTFTLTPNTFHVWDEVTSLTLNFGSGISGVANEYLFQFTSGPTATSLSLPDDIKWANDNVPTIGANMIYQVSVLRGLASVLEFNNPIVFPIIGDTGGNANEEYAKVYEYFVNTYNLTSVLDSPSKGVIITETLICNDTNYGGPVLKVSLHGTRLLLWTQNAINRYTVPTINNLGVYFNYYWD